MINITQVTKAELAELNRPAVPAVDQIVMTVAVEEYDDEDQVNESNFQDFLPDYHLHTPHINSLIAEDGLGLTPEAQAEWDEDPPEVQPGFETGSGA